MCRRRRRARDCGSPAPEQRARRSVVPRTGAAVRPVSDPVAHADHRGGVRPRCHGRRGVDLAEDPALVASLAVSSSSLSRRRRTSSTDDYSENLLLCRRHRGRTTPGIAAERAPFGTALDTRRSWCRPERRRGRIAAAVMASFDGRRLLPVHSFRTAGSSSRASSWPAPPASGSSGAGRPGPRSRGESLAAATGRSRPWRSGSCWRCVSGLIEGFVTGSGARGRSRSASGRPRSRCSSYNRRGRRSCASPRRDRRPDGVRGGHADAVAG